MLIGTQDDATVRELTSIEEQLAAAWQRHDCEAWSAPLADDWSVTHIDGQVISKREAMEMCRGGLSVSSVVDDLAVRVYGDTAVVTGRTTATVDGDARQQVILRFTDVFVRRDSCWRVVVSHATRVPEV